MKDISALPSGLFNRRVLLAFALCSVGVLLAVLSFAANPPSGMRGTSGSSTGVSHFVDNHAVPFKGNIAAMAASMPLNPRGPRWSIVESPNNGSPGTNQFFATTCVSASDCWAVGYSDIGNGYSTLIERSNGSVWKIVSSPNNSGNNILYGVTCTSTLDCWAVGTYWDDDLFQRTLIEHWNGDVWNIVSSPNRGLSSPPIDVLVGVACMSASECWAAGSNDDRNGVGQTLIERWDGTSWTIVDSPNPSGSNSFRAVTCASPSQPEECWAVGQTVIDLGRAQTLVEQWDGGTWSIVSSPNSGAWNDLWGVTCASQGDCWAVGDYSGVTNEQTLIEHWNGILWTIVSSPNTSTMQDNYLAAVACASARDCWAVGDHTNGSGVFQPQVDPALLSVSDDFRVLHIRTAERIRGLSVPFPLSVSFRIRARQEAQDGQPFCCATIRSRRRCVATSFPQLIPQNSLRQFCSHLCWANQGCCT